MPNNFFVPRDIISKLWTTPNALQLFAYLLSIADEEGYVKTDSGSIYNDIGLSQRKVVCGLALLTKAQIIDKKSENTFHIKALKPNHLTETHPLPTLSVDFTSFADTFNRKVKDTPIPQIRNLSDTRKRAVINRAKEYGGIEALEIILDKVVGSDFLSGRKTDFCATFDWIFKKANFIKILEGNYDNKPTAALPDTPVSRKEQRDRGLSLANTIVSNSENLLSLYNDSGENPFVGKD